jgi:excisionase family DNA binding protein
MKRHAPTRSDAKRQQSERRSPPPIAERPWLNLTETAEHFALHRTTVARLVRNGEIPAGVVTRFGNAIRINRVELERWLAKRNTGTDAAA